MKKPPRSGFADYQGDLELDMPEGTRPSELEKQDRNRAPTASTWSPPAREDDRASQAAAIRRSVPDPPKRGGFPWRAFFALLFLGGLGAGGYWGYCRYKVSDMEYQFGQASHDLKQALLRKNKTVTPADIDDVVNELAGKTNIEIDKTKLKIVIEPLDGANRKRLPAIAQTALSMAAKVSNHRAPRWFVGFSGRFRAKHGIAKKIFFFERYTWFDWAQPDGAAPTSR